MADPTFAAPDETNSTLVKKDQCDAAEEPSGSSASKKQEEPPCPVCEHVCYYYTIKCEMCEYDTFFLCNRVTLSAVQRMKSFYCKLCLNKKKNKLMGLAITYKESDDDKGVAYKFNPCDLPQIHKICSFEGKKCELRCFCAGGNCKKTFKLQCHRCKRFCHSECINMTPKESDRIQEYYCPPCCEEDPTLQIKRVEPKKTVKKKREATPSAPLVPKKRTRSAVKIEMKLKREPMESVETVTLDSDTDTESGDSHSTMTTPAAPSIDTATSAAQSRAVSEQPSGSLSPGASVIFGQYFEEELYSAAASPAAVDQELQPCSSGSLGVGARAASQPPAQRPESSGHSKKKVSEKNTAKTASAAATNDSVKRLTPKVPKKSVKQEPTDAVPYSVLLAEKRKAACVDMPSAGSYATAQPSSACRASVDRPSAAPPQAPLAQSADVVTSDPPVSEASRASSRSATTPTKHKASTTRLISVKVETIEAASPEFNGQAASNVVVELAVTQAANQELRDKVDSLTKELKEEKETTTTLKELLVDREVELAKLKKERAVADGASGDGQRKDTRIQELEKQVADQAQVISRLSVRLSALEQEKTLNNPA